MTDLAGASLSLSVTSVTPQVIIPVDAQGRDLVIQPDDHNRFRGIKLISQSSEVYQYAEEVTASLGYEAPPYISKWGINYRISDPPAQFLSPDYSAPGTSRSRIPDLRNTMYWNPGAKSGSDGIASLEFWTSDYAIEYVITVQGIADNGEAVSIRREIKIE